MASIPQVVTLIHDHVINNDMAPSISQLSILLGCSKSTAHTIVHGLIDRGYVEHAGREKTITLTEKALELIDTINRCR
jgi:DNA-binding IclR family transcriptional regulator